MLGAVRGLLGHATGLAHARVALFGTELREELVRSGLLLLAAGAALGLALLAVAALAAGIILGAENRVAAAFAVALAFAAGGAYAAWRVRKALAGRPAAFSASLAQLEQDREALAGRSGAERAGLGEAGGELLRLVSIGVLAYSITRRLTSRK